MRGRSSWVSPPRRGLGHRRLHRGPGGVGGQDVSSLAAVHEQTVLLGPANRMPARAATRIAVSSEPTLPLLLDPVRETAVVTGNPVRAEVLYGQADRASFQAHAARLAGNAVVPCHATRFIGPQLPDVLALAARVVVSAGVPSGPARNPRAGFALRRRRIRADASTGLSVCVPLVGHRSAHWLPRREDRCALDPLHGGLFRHPRPAAHPHPTAFRYPARVIARGDPTPPHQPSRNFQNHKRTLVAIYATFLSGCSHTGGV